MAWLEFLGARKIVACDAEKGLLSIDIDSGQVTTLVSEIDGKKLTLCNNAAVARNGTIYFSQSSTRFGIVDATRDILEHIPTGRLLRRTADGEVDCLVDKLQFANGVALSADESFVLVAETGAARIMRYWLKGEKQGQKEVFVDDLPGLPDNLSLGTDGFVWVALVAPMSNEMRRLHSAPAWIRKIATFFVLGQAPSGKRTVQLAAYDAQGKCQYLLSGDAEKFHMASGVREQNGQVAIGSVGDDKIAGFEFSQPRRATGEFKTVRIQGNRQVGYFDSGEGTTVVLSASLGRSVSDFNELTRELNRAGYRTIGVESRGIGPGLRAQRFRAFDLFALADDIAAVLAQEKITDQVSVLGHAFGNRVVRCFATKYPAQTRRVALLSAGGVQKTSPEIEQALRQCFAHNLPPEQHDQYLKTAFFGDSSVIPAHWRTGWHSAAAIGQAGATRRTEAKKWRQAGGKPILLLQGAKDAVAPAELTAAPMKRLFGDQIEIVELAQSGHAILPEEEGEVAAAVLRFLKG